MKHWKKLLVAVAAVVMAMAMAVPAYAATSDASDTYKVAKVEVDGIKDGNTLTLYKIVQFNLDPDTNAFDYTLATGLPEAYNTIEELAALTPNGYTLADSSATIRVAADTLANGIAAGTITPISTESAAADGNKATIENLPAGWYVAVVTGTADTGIIYQNMIINAMPVVENNAYTSAADVSFSVKHSDETITKTVGDDNAETTDKYSVGDSVPFTINTNIPNYPNPAEVATFVIKDTPTNLTDDVSTVKVTVTGDKDTGSDAGSISGKFTVAASENGFTVTFEKDYILAHPGAAVTVNYNGVISTTAVIANDGETASNTAEITFNPNPNDSGEVKPYDTTKLYTYGVTVLKYKDGDTSTTLPGAKFVLYADDGETVVRAETEVDSNGKLTWDGLEAGNYKLQETKAPAGYRLDSTLKDVTLSANTATGDDPLKNDTQTYVLEKQVPNTQGSTLPATGGIGTTILYIVGGIMVLLAVVFLITKKRVAATKKESSDDIL